MNFYFKLLWLSACIQCLCGNAQNLENSILIFNRFLQTSDTTCPQEILIDSTSYHEIGKTKHGSKKIKVFNRNEYEKVCFGIRKKYIRMIRGMAENKCCNQFVSYDSLNCIDHDQRFVLVYLKYKGLSGFYWTDVTFYKAASGAYVLTSINNSTKYEHQYKSDLYEAYEKKVRESYLKPYIDMAEYWQDERQVIPFHRGKWGLMDLKEREILKPTFDKIYSFKDYYAIVVKDGKYNLIDTNMNLVFRQYKSKITSRFDSNYSILNDDNTWSNYPPETVDLTPRSEGDESSIEPPRTFKRLPKAEKKIQERGLEVLSRYNDHCVIYNGQKLDTIKGYSNYFIAALQYVVAETDDSVFIFKTDYKKPIFKSPKFYVDDNGGYLSIFFLKQRRIGVFIFGEDKYIPPKYMHIKPRFNFYQVITPSGHWGYINNKGKELFDFK